MKMTRADCLTTARWKYVGSERPMQTGHSDTGAHATRDPTANRTTDPTRKVIPRPEGRELATFTQSILDPGAQVHLRYGVSRPFPRQNRQGLSTSASNGPVSGRTPAPSQFGQGESGTTKTKGHAMAETVSRRISTVKGHLPSKRDCRFSIGPKNKSIRPPCTWTPGD